MASLGADESPRRRPFSAALALCVLALAIAAATAFAAAGDPDSSFSGNGRQTLDFGTNDAEEGKGVAIQPNGKIVVAGTSFQGADKFAVARFNGNGSPDPSFSSDGRRTFGFGNNSAEGNAVAIQPNGKIVLAGRAFRPGGFGFAVIRLNPNGAPDPTFSSDGRQAVDIGTGTADDRATGVAIQGDGKIVLAGSSDQDPGVDTVNDDFAVVRLNTNGSPDQSFSGDGQRTIGFANGDKFDQGNAMAIQPNGKIVVAGRSDQYPDPNAANFDFAVARFNANGSPDQSFSDDGKRIVAFPTSSGDVANAVAIQPNGRIVVAGTSFQFSPNFDNDFGVFRLKANGNLDRNFSDDGRRTIGFANANGRIEDHGHGVAIQADGKIAVAGYSEGSGFDFAVARLNPGGNLDQDFSSDGRRTLGFANPGANDYGFGMALQPNGRIVVAGSSDRDVGPDVATDFAVARLLAN